MRCLDLFCGGGGASMGYFQAGYDDVTGVDIEPQPHYPFRFILGDALEYVRLYGSQYDLIHASPPCQKYSVTSNLWGREYPDLLHVTRECLVNTGRAWVIENVTGAPFMWAIQLCGAMFGLRTYRHRLFECSQLILAPPHPEHKYRVAKCGRRPNDGEYMSVVGKFIGVDLAREIMGIDWMIGRELSQAIPPVYTEFVGSQLLSV
ncbi:MAG: DNA cytosine methyltransferase [Candidatus Paceibacterota bacterium]|jgi:DNA (cytosine-5)-methyltransferase 1